MGNFDIVKFLLNACKNDRPLKEILFQGDESQNTPLHLAVKNKNMDRAYTYSEIMADLIDSCEEDRALKELLLQPNNKGETPLHLLAANNDSIQSKLSLERMTILLTACKEDRLLKELLFQPNQEGETPLLLASKNNQLKIVELLLTTCGKNKRFKELLFKSDPQGRTALYYITLGTDLNLMVLLLKACEDDASLLYLLFKETLDGDTPFHIAARNNNYQMIRTIFSSCELDTSLINLFFKPGKNGYLILHEAVKEGRTMFVQILINQCAYDSRLKRLLFKQDSNGCNALHISIKYGITSITHLLLDTCANDPSLLEWAFRADKNKQTLLHLAISDLATVKLLLTACGEHKTLKELLLARDELGRTPFSKAIQEDRTNVVQEILTYCKDDKSLKMHLFKMHANEDILTLVIKNRNQDILKEIISICNQNKNIKDLLFNTNILNTVLEFNDFEFLNSILISFRGFFNKEALLAMAKIKGMAMLQSAISDNNLVMAKQLIETYGEDEDIQGHLFKPDKEGWTPLNKAVINNNLEMVELLLTVCKENRVLKEQMFQPGINGLTPLHSAVLNVNPAMVVLLLTACRDDTALKKLLFEKDPCGNTPLTKAIIIEAVPLVEAFVNAFEDDKDLKTVLFEQNTDGNSPLHITVKEEIVNALLRSCGTDRDLKAILFKVNNEGDTPLHKALRNKKPGLIPIFLKACGEDNDLQTLLFKKGSKGDTPLIIAIQNNEELSIVKDLLNACTNKSILFEPDSLGNTPLLKAIKNNRIDMVKALLDSCEENQELQKILLKPNSVGDTPLLEAINNLAMVNILSRYCRGKKPLIDLLFKPKNNGETPLHIAAKQNLEGVVDEILTFCSEVSHLKEILFGKDQFQKTPIDYAIFYNNSNIFFKLISAYPGDVEDLIFTHPSIEQFIMHEPLYQTRLFELLGGFEKMSLKTKLSLLSLFTPNQIFEIINQISAEDYLEDSATHFPTYLNQLIELHHLRTITPALLDNVAYILGRDLKKLKSVHFSALTKQHPDIIIPFIPICNVKQLACIVPFLNLKDLQNQLLSKLPAAWAIIIVHMTTQQKREILVDKTALQSLIRNWDKSDWESKIAQMETIETLLMNFTKETSQIRMRAQEIQTLKKAYLTNEEEAQQEIEACFSTLITEMNTILQQIDLIQVQLNELHKKQEKDPNEKFYDSITGDLMIHPIKLPKLPNSTADDMWIDKSTLNNLRLNNGKIKQPFTGVEYPASAYVIDHSLQEEIENWNKKQLI